MSRPLRLLVFSRHSPFPSHDGASAYLFDLLTYLSRHNIHIELAWLNPDSRLIARGTWRVPAELADVFHLHLPNSITLGSLRIFPLVRWLPFKARALHRTKRILQTVHLLPPRPRHPRPPSAADEAFWFALPSPADTAFARQLIADRQPDAVLANFAWLAPLLAHAGSARKLVLAHDVASARARVTNPCHATRNIPPHLASLEAETTLLAHADQVLAITEEDAAVFRPSPQIKSVLIVPKAGPIHPPRDLTAETPGRCLFVGGMNPPNRDGLHWFLSHVWPLILNHLPDASLHLCGAICGAIAEPPPRVALVGRVADLTPEYEAAAVVIVPLLTGTGMKIKLVEAVSHGVACVTTPVGLQGLSFLRPTVREAESDEQFAAAVIDLLRHPESRHDLGHRSWLAANTHLHPEQCYQPVLKALRPLPHSPSPAPQPALTKTAS